MDSPPTIPCSVQANEQDYHARYVLKHGFLFLFAYDKRGRIHQDSAHRDNAQPEDQARRLLLDMVERGSLG